MGVGLEGWGREWGTGWGGVELGWGRGWAWLGHRVGQGMGLVLPRIWGSALSILMGGGQQRLGWLPPAQELDCGHLCWVPPH